MVLSIIDGFSTYLLSMVLFFRGRGFDIQGQNREAAIITKETVKKGALC
jgi:hypothetical protein